MYKYITTIVIVLVAGFILLGLGRQISDAILAGQRLDNEAEDVNKLQQQNRELKQKLSQVGQPDYIEQIARDKLNLAKPGETIVVVPDNIIDRALAAQNPPTEAKLTNWQGWLRLFIH